MSDKVLSASAADLENETCDFQNGASAHVATADTLERARGASTELPRPAQALQDAIGEETAE